MGSKHKCTRGQSLHGFLTNRVARDSYVVSQTGLILSEDLAKLVAGVSAKKRGLTAEV